MLNLWKVLFLQSASSRAHRLYLQNALTNYERLRLIRELRRKPAEGITAYAFDIKSSGMAIPSAGAANGSYAPLGQFPVSHRCGSMVFTEADTKPK